MLFRLAQSDPLLPALLQLRDAGIEFSCSLFNVSRDGAVDLFEQGRGLFELIVFNHCFSFGDLLLGLGLGCPCDLIFEQGGNAGKVPLSLFLDIRGNSRIDLLEDGFGLSYLATADKGFGLSELRGGFLLGCACEVTLFQPWYLSVQLTQVDVGCVFRFCEQFFR